jgi:hypothetical protein
MKKYIIITGCFGLIFLAACSKLDRVPLDASTDATYWQTANEIRLAANACYDFWNIDNTAHMEHLSDNTVYFQVSDWRVISSGNFDASNGIVQSTWAQSYGAIRRCNDFLENYKKAVMDSSLRERYAGEVRFIRTYWYWTLTTLYGDVPFITKTLTASDPEVYGKRTSKDTIVQWMLKELTDIKLTLPVTYPAADRGRVTRGATLALKARIALFNKKWQVAVDAAMGVDSLGVYSLYISSAGTGKQYQQLFDHVGKPSSNANNKEDIFWRPYLQGQPGQMHNLAREIQLPNSDVRYQPTKSLVDAYLCSDGKPIDKSSLYSINSFGDYWKNRDPRMSQTILAVNSGWLGTGYGGNIFSVPFFYGNSNVPMTQTGFYFTKYCDQTQDGGAGGGFSIWNYNNDGNDMHMIRYGEVLLTYAEAKLELGTLSQTDLDYTVNKLRDRVGMHHMILSELTAWSMDIRTEIYRERRIEMAMEGMRYFDILRLKQGSLLAAPVKGMRKDLVAAWSWQVPMVAGYAADANGDMIIDVNRQFVDPKNYLWPVPQTEYLQNPNLLPNNPGW